MILIRFDRVFHFVLLICPSGKSSVYLEKEILKKTVYIDEKIFIKYLPTLDKLLTSIKI